MFGGKREKTREIEEKLREAEILKAEHELLKHTIRGTKNTSGEKLAALEAGDTQLDKDLTQLVEYFKKGEQEGGFLSDALLHIRDHLKELAALAVTREQKDITIRTQMPPEAINSVEETSQALLQLKADCHTSIIDMEENKSAGKDLKEMTDAMQQSAKQMGVMALNAAIEAGRLGEQGKEFIQAAEDVRKLAESYDSASGEALDKIQELEDRFLKQQKRLESMEKKLEQKEKVIGLLLEKHNAQDNESGDIEDVQQPQAQIAKELKEQETEVVKITERLEEHLKVYGNSFRQIEAIGASYMETRKAKGELEDCLGRLYDKVKK